MYWTIDDEVICAFIQLRADFDYWPNAPKYEATYLHNCVRHKCAGIDITTINDRRLRMELWDLYNER